MMIYANHVTPIAPAGRRILHLKFPHSGSVGSLSDLSADIMIPQIPDSYKGSLGEYFGESLLNPHDSPKYDG